MFFCGEDYMCFAVERTVFFCGEARPVSVFPLRG